MKMKWIFCLLPMLATQALAQDVPPDCTPLVTIQGKDCSVRLVFTCASDTQPLRWVVTYGPSGPISLAILDQNGMPQVLQMGKGQPKGTLNADGDLVDLAKVLAGEMDSFDYRLDFEDGTVLATKGNISLSDEVIEVDGRSLKVLDRQETMTPPNGKTMPETLNRLLYDAELGLVINSVISDPVSGEVLMDRSPVDYLLPGETGAESTIPLYGCEG
jgi:hypothetical protein